MTCDLDNNICIYATELISYSWIWKILGILIAVVIGLILARLYHGKTKVSEV